MLANFEIALSKLHKAGEKKYGASWIPRLENRRAKLEGAYATLYEQDRDPISYSSMSAQTAYVFAYAPARAEYTRQYLHRHRKALGIRLFAGTKINLVSFGGGPASELVGVVRYIEESNEVVEQINYVVYDKDGDWAEVARMIVDDLDTNIEITMTYEEVDAASRSKMSDVDVSQVDLIIFSYIMSELARLGRRDQIAENFRLLLKEMKVGSKILFIDNLHPIFIKYFYSCKIVRGLVQKNDDSDPVDCDFSNPPATFKALSDALEWSPRTSLKSVSKMNVRTNL